MDNKQNQPNSGTSSSSSSSAANKPASQQADAPVASASTSPSSSPSAATSGRQQSASASISARQPQAQSSTPDSQDSAASKPSQQQDTAPRKSWLDQEQWAKSVDQLPQSLKNFGSKALEQVNSLSTTQKVVGGALLVSGLSWLALRSKSKSSAADTSRYTPKGESKWKASSESVYRGATTTLHNSDDSFSF